MAKNAFLVLIYLVQTCPLRWNFDILIYFSELRTKLKIAKFGYMKLSCLEPPLNIKCFFGC